MQDINVPEAISDEEAEKKALAQFSERFDQMVKDLQFSKGWTKRRATRYLEKKARIANKKFIKEGAKRRAQMEKDGTLIDTADLAEKLDAEFEKELEAAGMTKADLDPMVPADEWPEEKKKYTPPTRDF